jgi:hypothetical protein
MKRALLIGIGVVAFATAAHAELDCGPMKFFTGESGKNPVSHTTVSIDGDRRSIVHHMQDGHDYDRNVQYNIGPVQVVGDNRYWDGVRNNNPQFRMTGMLWKHNGRYFYSERVLYNGKRVGDTVQDCGLIADPTPVVAHDDPNPVIGGDRYAEITVNGGAVFTRVRLGDQWTTMMVDTGANVSSISESLADRLIASGHATEGDPVTVTLADGSQRENRTIVVDHVWVGHEHGGGRAQVTMGVAPDDTDQLLGYPLIDAIGGKVTVDRTAGRIVFGG